MGTIKESLTFDDVLLLPRYSEVLPSETDISLKLTNKISNEGTQVIWWSNAFHTVNAHYIRGLQGDKNCYNDWIQQLNNNDENENLLIKRLFPLGSRR